MKKFITTVYKITSDKIKRHPLKFIMISDLHNVVLGNQNKEVFDKIKEWNPDAILIAGDLVLGKTGEPLQPALTFLKQAAALAPVIYAPGNHEQRMKNHRDVYGSEFGHYEKALKEMGVIYLENERTSFTVKGESVTVFGLDLPEEYYKHGIASAPDKEVLAHLLGMPEESSYNILLAHTPRFGSSYFAWGGDLILSGHYHGGIMRFPFLGGVLSPDIRLFPRFSYGLFKSGKQHMITGAGLGEHTIPVRINNPRELVAIECQPE